MQRSKTYPENELGVGTVPAVSDVVGEKTPGKSVVFIRHQYTDSVHANGLRHVFFPNHRQEQRSSRIHHCNVRQDPMPVVCLQRVHDLQEEGMLRNRAHGVVGDSSGFRSADPCRV